MSAPSLAVVVMGVSGSGKSSVGRELAQALAAEFIEGDELHSDANRQKMSAGIPLNDGDRWPWLERIGAALRAAHASGYSVVATCSALKRAYRDRLRDSSGARLRFVCLTGERALLAQRMSARQGHFMPPALLDSQLATLELPAFEEPALCIDVSAPVPEIVAATLRWLADGGAPALG